jgi:FkbM family methyltransferase
MKMKIAWFTPFPPEKSAIGEYSLIILKELCKRDIEVVLWLDFDYDSRQIGLNAPVLNYSKNPGLLDLLSSYDLIVYNIGNNFENHYQLYEISLRFPGVVILHDYVLHHFFAAYYLAHNANPLGYIDAMYKAHGDEGREIAQAVVSRMSGPPIWETDEVINFPMNKLAISKAYAVITHSSFVLEKLKEHYKGIIKKIDFPSKPMVLSGGKTRKELDIPDDKFILLTLGEVNPNKRIDKVIRAISKSEYLRENVIYVIIGKYSPAHYDIETLVEELGLNRNIRILGRQPDDVVQGCLGITDIGLNLRFPTMGESSWTLLQMMQLGIPCVVTKIGGYDEIPDDCVVKVDLDSEVEVLSKYLTSLCMKKEMRETLGYRGKRYADVTFSTKRYCDKFLELCEQTRRAKEACRLVDVVSSELNQIGVTKENGAELINVLSDNIASFIPPLSTSNNENEIEKGISKGELLERTKKRSLAAYKELITNSSVTKTSSNKRVLAPCNQKLIDINEFTKLDGLEFLVNLYRGILGREPDEKGLEHYLNLLAEGYHKEVLLLLVARSDEAKKSGIRISGAEPFKKAYYIFKLKRAIKRIPLVMPIYRLLTLPNKVNYINRLITINGIVMDHRYNAQKEEIRKIISKEKDRKDEKISDILAYQQRVNNHMAVVSAKFNELERLVSGIKLNVESSINNLAISCANNIVVTKVDEFIIGLPAEEWRMVGYMAFKGQLEPGLTRLFRSCVKPGMVVIDVGANVGAYTLIAASLVGMKGKVYSFEPTPNTFNILKGNVQVNGFLETGIVDMHQIAVSRENGSAHLAIYNRDSGHNTLFPSDEDKSIIEVRTISLDTFLDGAPVIDIVKIDAEGSEPFILQGMHRIIERNPGITVFLEFAPSNLRNAGIQPDKFLNDIRSLGFNIKKIEDLTGETLQIKDEELLQGFSTNIMLKKAPPPLN